MPKKDVIPKWFTEAINAPCEDQYVTVEDGARLHYLAWGEKDLPGLFLVHGGGAHAHWWSFLASLFADQYRVIVPESRGMGDSDYSKEYLPDRLSDDLIAICDEVGLRGKVTMVGHSFGGYVVLKTAARHPDRLRGLVVCDTPIRSADVPSVYDPNGGPMRNKKIYSDFQEVAGRFRLIPDQPINHRYLVDYATRHALRREGDGWTWKFDQQFFAHLSFEEPNDWLAQIQCPAAVVYGEKSSLMTETVLAHMKAAFPAGTPIVGVPDAYHHLMFDQPLALVEVLKEIVGECHSQPGA